MSNQEKIINILKTKLGYIYCNNCFHNGSDNCDECSRKSMGWQPSDDFLKIVSDEILKEVKINE